MEWLHTVKGCNTPTVCVVVYGNRGFDDALLELKQALEKNGCIPIACAAYVGEHSCSNAETPIAAGRPDSDDLLHAQSFGEKIKQKISSVPSIEFITDLAVPGEYPYIDNIDSKKKLSNIDLVAVDNNCVQCGACAQLCPVGAIEYDNSASVDTNECIVCHACIKKCPKNARKIKSDTIKAIALRMSGMLHVRKEPVIFL